MSHNVVGFKGGLIPDVLAPPDPELIETLRQLLDDARLGHLRAIAYSAVNRERGLQNRA